MEEVGAATVSVVQVVFAAGLEVVQAGDCGGPGGACPG